MEGDSPHRLAGCGKTRGVRIEPECFGRTGGFETAPGGFPQPVRTLSWDPCWTSMDKQQALGAAAATGIDIERMFVL